MNRNSIALPDAIELKSQAQLLYLYEFNNHCYWLFAGTNTLPLVSSLAR